MRQRVSERLAPFSIAVFLALAAGAGVVPGNLASAFPCLNCWQADTYKQCGECLNDPKHENCAEGTVQECERCCDSIAPSNKVEQCKLQCLAGGGGSNDNPEDRSDDLSD